MATINGTSGNDILFGTAETYDLINGYGGNDIIYGGLGADNVLGGAGADIIYGGDGQDQLYGEDGDDYIDGDAGDDYIYGGAGNDIIHGRSGAGYLSGDGGDDSIYGGDGADTLDGGTGADYMVGGSGWDSYVVDSIYDVIVEANNGYSDFDNLFDSVTSSVSFASNSVELITLVGNSNINASYAGLTSASLTGNSGSNTLSGGNATDSLYGGGGNDFLYGGGGGDNLLGGAGADFMDGGPGLNLARYDLALVGVIASLYDPSINTGEAAGDIYVNIDNFVGSAFADFLFGNASSNLIRGYDGDDWIDGVGGADSLNGEGGNDNLMSRAGAQAFDGGTGFDYVRYDYAASGISASLSNSLVNSGEAAGDSYAGIEGLAGSIYADWLYGDSGANTLNGNGGADYMAGGLGNDIYVVDNIYDVTDEANGGGVADYVYSSASLAAAAGIEAVALLGSSNLYAIGLDSQADYLIGNSGNNYLEGKAGNDTLLGGQGTDYFLGGAGADNFVFSGDIQLGQYDVIGDFQTGLDRIGLPASARNSVYVFDSVYGATIGYNSGGSWYQIFVSNTHSVAQVTASIYYA